MTAGVDVVRRAPAVVVVPVDTFLVASSPGPPLGLDRPARSPLRFRVLDADLGGGPLPLADGTYLAATRTASGAYVSYGELEGPDGVRRRLTGAPVTVRLAVESRFYRPAAQALAVRLENLDPGPAAPVVPIPPTVVELAPGVLYPFPDRWRDFGLVRGLVAGPGGGRGIDGVPVAAAAGQAGGVAAFADSYVTDRGGQFVFVVPDAGPAGRQLTLTAPGAAARTVAVPPSGAVTATTIVIT